MKSGFKVKTRKHPGTVKVVICSLPLAGAAATAMLPIRQVSQQFLMLIVLLWIQVFFISEVFLARK